MAKNQELKNLLNKIKYEKDLTQAEIALINKYSSTAGKHAFDNLIVRLEKNKQVKDV